MARESLTTQQITRDGLALTKTTPPPADGDVIDSGRTILVVENIGSASITVTVQSPLTVDGLDVQEQIVSIPAGETRYMGPWRESTFGRPAGTSDAGRVYVDYDTPADVSRAVMAL